MTTIAARRIDGKWAIAADSQETVEGEDTGDIKLPCQKLFVLGNGALVATAGNTVAGLKFVSSVAKTAHGTMQPNGFVPDAGAPFECLVLDRFGYLWAWDEDVTPVEITTEFWAIGTGRMCAFAAMEMGATPRQAVAIAAKYDPYTGGDIVVSE